MSYRQYWGCEYIYWNLEIKGVYLVSVILRIKKDAYCDVRFQVFVDEITISYYSNAPAAIHQLDSTLMETLCL